MCLFRAYNHRKRWKRKEKRYATKFLRSSREISKLKRYNISTTRQSISTITAAQLMQLRIFKSACQWNIERFRHLVSISISSELETLCPDRNWMKFAFDSIFGFFFICIVIAIFLYIINSYDILILLHLSQLIRTNYIWCSQRIVNCI